MKNVFPACEGSEKRYSVNRSESALMLVGQKSDEDKKPFSIVFDFIPKTHGSSGDCSAS